MWQFFTVQQYCVSSFSVSCLYVMTEVQRRTSPVHMCGVPHVIYLFIACLFILFVMYLMILSVVKWPWPNLSISLKILRETTEELSQTIWTPKPRIDNRTSEIQSRSANCLTMTLSDRACQIMCRCRVMFVVSMYSHDIHIVTGIFWNFVASLLYTCGAVCTIKLHILLCQWWICFQVFVFLKCCGQAVKYQMNFYKVS